MQQYLGSADKRLSFKALGPPAARGPGVWPAAQAYKSTCAVPADAVAKSTLGLFTAKLDLLPDTAEGITYALAGCWAAIATPSEPASKWCAWQKRCEKGVHEGLFM